MAGDSVGDLVASCVLLLGCVLPAIGTGPPLPPGPTSYEVIIPKLLAPRTGQAKSSETAYTITAAGTDYVVRLKRKEDLQVKDFPVFTYDSKGRRIKSYPYIPVGCYWEGYVENVPNSRVALNTCSGLRGFLRIKDSSYGIEPLHNASTFQHFFYRVDGTELAGAQGSRVLRLEYGTFPYLIHRGDPMYVELFVVVDNVMFHSEAGNESQVLTRVLDILSLVNTYYSYLQVHVAPVGLEIWTRRNLIPVSTDVADVLARFNTWRIHHLAGQVKHDTVHFFLYQRFAGEPGGTYPDAICKAALSVGVDSHAAPNDYLFSKVVAHVLGSSLGLRSDGPGCVCDEEESCIMHRFHSRGSLFSNCSVATYAAVLQSGRLACLADAPDFTKVLLPTRCGDGVLDPGEDCDCGGEGEDCQEDPCCNPDCTFKGDVLCTSGPCCLQCKYIVTGRLCRGKAAECDLPEYCSGESEWCPEDVYMQDGTPCNKTAYCYAKSCLTHDGLCAAIFGKGARGAPKSCFQALNPAGTQFGNCGTEGAGGPFLKCAEKDSLCGRAQCTGVAAEPHTWPSAQFARTTVQGVECWSIGFPRGQGGEDPGAIPNGTHCGAEKVCINRHCVALASLNLKAECDAQRKCHSRGVCNNRHNCHCNVGWAPPNCKYFGTGGSLDGGFPLQAWNTELMKLAFGVVIPAGLMLTAAITGLLGKLRVWLQQWR